MHCSRTELLWEHLQVQTLYTPDCWSLVELQVIVKQMTLVAQHNTVKQLLKLTIFWLPQFHALFKNVWWRALK